MATGEIQLPSTCWYPTDDTSGNEAADPITLIGSQSNPKSYTRVWAFDASTQEHIWTHFIIPNDYSSGGTLQVYWTSNDTGSNENPIWASQVSCTTPADTDTPLEHALSSAATVSDTINTTEARRLIKSSITLNMDSAAAGDLCLLLFYRDADAGGDDLTSDAEFWAAVFQYTTT